MTIGTQHRACGRVAGALQSLALLASFVALPSVQAQTIHGPFNVFVPLTRCLTFGVHSRTLPRVHLTRPDA
jgi:hypothetical protein